MYRRIFTALALIGLLAVGGVVRSRTGHGNAASLAYSASGKHVTFSTDPSAYGGGDQGMDNLYTLDNNICTDGIAITIAHQIMGDVGNTVAHQGHSLTLNSIQDYGTTAPGLPFGFDQSTGVPTAGNNVPIQEANSVNGAFTFASAADNAAGSWQGNVYKAHYASSGSRLSEPVGEQIVGSLVRADHGFVVNEDDDNRNVPGATVDLNSNGDDGRFNSYRGWGGTDDNDVSNNTNNTPPSTSNRDGDWYTAPDGVSPTDGSSFDDILRTDQSPGSGFDPTNPNSAPSFMVAPNPATSKVSDCVIDKNPPQTTITLPPLDSTGWYKASVPVSLVAHKAYYLGGAVTTSFQLDGMGAQAYNTPFTITGDATHTLGYYSSDSVSDTETTHSVTIKIDGTAPTVKFDAGACPVSPVVLGTSLPSATWSASDNGGGSGLATSAAGSVPLDSSALGTHSVSTPSPQDIAGNIGTAVTCAYTVQYGVNLLHKMPTNAKSGRTIPIKLQLIGPNGTNLSSSSLSIQALCVVPQGGTSCASAPPGFTYDNQFFTFLTSLTTGGGYQYDLKTTGLPAATYRLLFRVTGESSSTFHVDAPATFTLTK